MDLALAVPPCSFLALSSPYMLVPSPYYCPPLPTHSPLALLVPLTPQSQPPDIPVLPEWDPSFQGTGPGSGSTAPCPLTAAPELWLLYVGGGGCWGGAERGAWLPLPPGQHSPSGAQGRDGEADVGCLLWARDPRLAVLPLGPPWLSG